jgi:nucleoside-diphosphate-sugar epimerase
MVKIQKNKITIIGGSGFVGTYLCDVLKELGYNFEILDLKKSQKYPDFSKIADVRKIENLRNSITGNIIVNLAAVHTDDITNLSEYYETNVKGAENITTICNEKGINKIIFTSSVAVYGFATPGTSESGDINPFNEYGRSKYLAEIVFNEWQRDTEKSLIIVRPTVIFGVGNRGNVYNLFNHIYKKKFFMIGNGENKKSLAYVKNIALFLEHCINTNRKYGLFNYTDGPDLNMNQLVSLVRQILFSKSNVGIRIPYKIGMYIGYLAELVARHTHIKLPISRIRVKKFVSTTEFLSSKEDLDNFKTCYPLEQAIEETLRHEFLQPNKQFEIFYTE